MKKIENSRKNEKGFTLVELAIVMIIIGLLIGGILKGQELIANAQISSTVAQTKGITAATSTFNDSYRALPGDMTNPTTRLPNCTSAPCNNVGNGNGRLAGVPGANTMAGDNAGTFFAHLNAADLVTGVDGSNTLAWGQGLPAASIGGGIGIGYHNTGTLGLNTAPRAGHYLTIQGSPAALGTDALTPSEAARIDRKLDDGSPTTGAVFGDDAACGAGTNYVENTPDDACEIFIRL